MSPSFFFSGKCEFLAWLGSVVFSSSFIYKVFSDIETYREIIVGLEGADNFEKNDGRVFRYFQNARIAFRYIFKIFKYLKSYFGAPWS